MTRLENAERSNELIAGENSLPAGFTERPVGFVQAYTAGYDRDFDFIPISLPAIGGQFTMYSVRDSLKPLYGWHPVRIALFIRLRPSANHRDR